MENNNVTKLSKGLFRDCTHQDQPEGSYRFALNSIRETDQGDNTGRSNEESNIICAALSPGYIPIGKVYMNNDEICVWSVSADDSISEIGIFKTSTCTYITHVNDFTSVAKDKLKFSVQHQIEGTYRLRLGCENTVYWVDSKNKPRYYNFNKPNYFKNSAGNWVASKFNLQKTYETIPVFANMEVLVSGGTLEPGSYNFAVQYVDESLNPTEWITTSPTVKIYNDLPGAEYGTINGSINSDQEHLNFPKTGKAIKIDVSNLDSNFLYYRLAIIASNNGSGLINDVLYTEVIPVSKTFFIYTGLNHVEKGTEEEILQFTDILEKAVTIEQIENRLIIANTQGRQTNLCKLQKFASRIKADCIIKEVELNNIEHPNNTKNPVHEFNNGIGYMPGEIYSFGIVYIFEDNSLSPVFHIPGKAQGDENIIFSPSFDGNGNSITFPMSTNNESESNTYSNNNTCGTSSYWGLDYNGTPLTSKKVRHHRFPLRSDIGVPLVEAVNGNSEVSQFYNLLLNIQGTLKVPVPCPESDPTCGTAVSIIFNIRVDYTVNDESFFFIVNIDPETYADGATNTFAIDLIQESQYHDSDNFTNIEITISDINGNYQPISGFDFSPYFTATPTLSTYSEAYSSSTADRTYKTKILGIKFSGIEDIPIQETGELKVIGYYIVRNERTEFEKTILDSGVMVPTLSNSKYISHGLLVPDNISKNSTVYSLIHPEHKFNQKEYVKFDELIQEGNFKITSTQYGKINYNDVQDGTSYNPEKPYKHHKKNDDADPADGDPTSKGLDGWSLNLITRDSIVDFENKKNFTILGNEVKDNFYLDALGSKDINNGQYTVYNIATDNKINIIQTYNQKVDFDVNKLPYVIMYKKNSDPYANFRLLPYYKENTNPIYFNSPQSTATIFNGDSYVTPMRYNNTVFFDNRIADRIGKIPAWKIIVGAIIAVIGVVAGVFSGGSGAVVAAIGIGAIIGGSAAIVGAGALLVSSGIKQANFQKAYAEEYQKGLRNTALDLWTSNFYNYGPLIGLYFQPPFTGTGSTGFSGPSDDTIQWVSDCITDLWFESAINMNLRNRFHDDVMPTFLFSPWKVESGNNIPIRTEKIKSKYYTSSNGAPRYPVSSLERHGTRKLLAFDEKRDDNKIYLGIALGEYYNVNPDYMRRNFQKIFYHLPLEYDCCSDCREKFPQRIYYSEQSYQEELSDNFRIFLPNNYRDISGETGVITNLHKIGMDLFVHTEEALWQMPRNHQERITDQIVSFIGTGDYFSVPPRMIVDDSSGNSAGCEHRWGVIKTPYGIFFPTEKQNKIYQFDGKQLKAISNIGMSSWFKNNIEFQMDKNYLLSTGKKYPFRNNPSNFFGTGFVSTYDSRKERFLLTKRDFNINLSKYEDFEMCTRNGELVIFNNMQNIIDAESTNGWEYVGLEDCQLKFEREVIEEREEERIERKISEIGNETDIIIQFDRSGSFGNTGVANVKNTVITWFNTFKSANPSYTGKLIYLLATQGCSGQAWLRTLNWLQNDHQVFVVNTDSSDPNYLQETPITFSSISQSFVVVSTVNEATIGYCGGTGEYHEQLIQNPTPAPSAEYISDFNDFVNRRDALTLAGYTMNFLQYPIVYSHHSMNMTQGMLQHSISAIVGETLNPAELTFLADNPNPFVIPLTVTPPTDYTLMITALGGPNPYPKTSDNRSLRDLGWQYKHTRGWNGVGDIIPVEQFTQDIEEFLTSTSLIEDIVVTVTVPYIVTEYKYLDGIPVRPQYINNSWTMSYDIEEQYWLSWHSYMPNMYFNVPEDFYSWVHGDSNFWKHNALGSYQQFYGGKVSPFILEFVSVSNPISDRIWNHIKMFTEAKKYDGNFNEFKDERFVTFNKGLFYNSRQNSGILNFIVKDIHNVPEDYLLQQVENLPGDSIIIDRNEGDWSINNLRDMRVDHTVPMFDSSPLALQPDYYIDKVVNPASIDFDKDWMDIESFRDKYLVIRLIFDNFDDIKLIFNNSVENEVKSFR